MIIYGIKSTHADSFTLPGHTCSFCGKTDTMSMSFYGKYVHIYWIPVTSVGMNAYVSCGHCKQILEENQFNSDLRDIKKMLRVQTRIPKWHFILVGVFALFFGFILIMAALQSLGIVK